MLLRTIERKDAPAAPAAEIKAALEALGKTTQDGMQTLSDRMDKLETKQNRPRFGGGSHDDETKLAAERKALATFARTGNDAEFKTLQAGSQPDGGYMVHSALSTQMTKRIFDQSPMRRLCRIETIGAGDAFEEPVDVDEAGATWVGENSARPATTTAQLKLRRTPVEEIYSLQPVTQRLLDDADWDVGAWIEGKVADKFARTEGVAFNSGNGIAKPRGFMTYDVDTAVDITRDWTKLQYVVSGSASAIADVDGGANGIKDLYWALRAQHRANATWVMASATANALDKLKDNNKDYIWRPGMTAGAPPSRLGRPVQFDENMPAISSNTFPVAFGDWKAGYIIVDKPGIKWLRDPFTSKPNVLFYAYMRVGGGVANFDAIKLLKISS